MKQRRTNRKGVPGVRELGGDLAGYYAQVQAQLIERAYYNAGKQLYLLSCALKPEFSSDFDTLPARDEWIEKARRVLDQTGI